MYDASNSALRAILGQRVGKQPHVIAYASRTMDPEFDVEIREKKGVENAVADHLSQLEREVHSRSRDPVSPPSLSCSFQRRPLWIEFGVSKALISDQGSHFYNRAMATLLKKYRVVHRVATTYHPRPTGKLKNSTGK
ncbi:hypothetical protein CR513_42572, partial [Mucuna pruriens]